MKYIEFKKNSNTSFYYNGNYFIIQHNKYGYKVLMWIENGYYPVIKGKNSRRKNLSTINKYMKEYDIEFIDHFPFQMIWENEHCCDGIECMTLEEAKDHAINCLIEWQVDERNKHPHDITTWTEKDIEEWDMFISNCSARVVPYNEETETYENDEFEWYPSYEDEKEIAWLYYEELKVLETNSLNG